MASENDFLSTSLTICEPAASIPVSSRRCASSKSRERRARGGGVFPGAQARLVEEPIHDVILLTAGAGRSAQHIGRDAPGMRGGCVHQLAQSFLERYGLLRPHTATDDDADRVADARRARHSSESGWP